MVKAQRISEQDRGTAVSCGGGAEAGRDLARSERAQREWAATEVRARVKVLRRARALLAERATAFCEAMPSELERNAADTLVAELLPLLEACRFLEKNAVRILRTRALGRSGLPWWLGRMASCVERTPLGEVLIIGPGNYPLLLPGVSALQALAAGNAVVWKPGRGGRDVAALFAEALREAGLPDGLLRVTDDTPEAGEAALDGLVTGRRPDKVIFTGSAETGRRVLRRLAESATPCVAELSGCDAVVVLRSAETERVVRACAFGMRLNGSATCMAPRRLLLVGMPRAEREELIARLQETFRGMVAVAVGAETAERVIALVEEARVAGAAVPGGWRPMEIEASGKMSPVLVTDVAPEMAIARSDIFAPVLSVIEVADEAELLHADACCPFALTAAVFGERREAVRVGRAMTAGTVLVNDVIVPTADPRVPFSGRRGSGFGATRGAEGLLEMTAPRAVLVRRGGSTRHYDPTGREHEGFFRAMILATHGGTLGGRWNAVRSLMVAARGLGKTKRGGA